jgi:hypothetical protein
LALRGVVLFVLRAASGIAEATMDADGSGKAKSPGFYVSHNPQTRAVFVEALGYGNSERQMLDRYKRMITRAFQTTLGLNADALNRLVQVLPANMVRVSDLTDAQIATLRARYSV